MPKHADLSAASNRHGPVEGGAPAAASAATPAPSRADRAEARAPASRRLAQRPRESSRPRTRSPSGKVAGTPNLPPAAEPPPRAAGLRPIPPRPRRRRPPPPPLRPRAQCQCLERVWAGQGRGRLLVAAGSSPGALPRPREPRGTTRRSERPHRPTSSGGGSHRFLPGSTGPGITFPSSMWTPSVELVSSQLARKYSAADQAAGISHPGHGRPHQVSR